MGKFPQVEAARLLKRSSRQIRRIQRRLEAWGDGGVVHGLRGRASNNGSDAAMMARAAALCRKHYAGFGPTMAREKLLEEHKLSIGLETLRQLLLREGLWEPKRHRDKHRRRRERRSCFGEMVQADASEHDWLEGRGPMLTLVGMPPEMASPSLPRSLSPMPIPVSEETGKANDPVRSPTGPLTVHRTGARSGRTPALPCPPAGESCSSGKNTWRPASTHPWRGSPKTANRTL